MACYFDGWCDKHSNDNRIDKHGIDDIESITVQSF